MMKRLNHESLAYFVFKSLISYVFYGISPIAYFHTLSQKTIVANYLICVRFSLIFLGSKVFS